METPFRTAMTAAAMAAAAFLLPAPPARAQTAQNQGLPPQSSTLPALPEPEAVVIQATITAINPHTRTITLRGTSGTSVTMHAGDAVRIELLKVGDRVTAKYYRSIAFALGTPGKPAPDNEVATLVAQKASGPGGAAVRVTRISAVIVGIDLQNHSVDVVDPKGGPVRTIVVKNPDRIAMLPDLKVGDTITAAVSEALAVSVTPAPKS
jgi:hypothetical protein